MKTLYTQPNTKQREASFFQGFLESRPEFLAYNFVHLDNPDFQGVYQGKRIGVEVTSLIDDDRIKIRQVKEQALHELAGFAKEQGYPPTWVRVHWKDTTSWCNKAELVKELTVKILPLFKKPRKSDRTVRFDIDTASNYVDEVMLTPTLDRYSWQTLPRNWVRQVTDSTVQSILEKKHAKLIEYLHFCDECWLLIGVDDWNSDQAYQLSPEARAAVYKTGFRRLFFLRNGESKVDELTTISFPGLDQVNVEN